MKLRDRLSYLPTAVAGMIGYVLWQAMIGSTGVSRSNEWVIAFVLVLGGIVVCTGTITTRRRAAGHPTANVAVPALVAPALAGAAGWRFDETAPIIVEADVEAVIRQVRPMIERSLVDVFEEPLTRPREVTKGEVVYIQRIDAGASMVDDAVNPPALLLGYAASQRDHAIRILGLGRAAEASAGSPTDAEALEALQRVTASVMARAYGVGHAPVAEH